MILLRQRGHVPATFQEKGQDSCQQQLLANSIDGNIYDARGRGTCIYILFFVYTIITDKR